MPSLSSDESRALAFVALLLALSAVARLTAREPDFAAEIEALDLASHAAAVDSALAERRRRERPLEPDERLDPNLAPAAELNRLPGVGPALADRIVADREANGPFRTTGDLTRVSGIGPRAIERLAPHLELPDGPPTGGGVGGAGPGPRVDPNRASAAELETLPGIGPAIAARIIAEREANGPFRSLDELLRVSGIGPATLDRLRPHLGIDP